MLLDFEDSFTDRPSSEDDSPQAAQPPTDDSPAQAQPTTDDSSQAQASEDDSSQAQAASMKLPSPKDL